MFQLTYKCRVAIHGVPGLWTVEYQYLLHKSYTGLKVKCYVK